MVNQLGGMIVSHLHFGLCYVSLSLTLSSLPFSELAGGDVAELGDWF